MEIRPTTSGDRQEQPTLIGREFGRYQVIEQVATDGLVSTFRAQDKGLSREVFLKVLAQDADEAVADRFLESARTAAALSHPNIGVIYDLGKVEGTAFAARAGGRARTLRARIDASDLDVEAALKIAAQAARGLAAGHAQGLAHGDFSADSVMTLSESDSESPVVKVVDFGLSAQALSGAVPKDDLRALGKLTEELARAVRGSDEAEVERLDQLRSLGGRIGKPATEGGLADAPSAAQALRSLSDDYSQGAAAQEHAAQVRREGAQALRRQLIAAGLFLAATAWFLHTFYGNRPAPEPLVVQPLTNFPGDERDVSFSPDGSQVVFAWRRPGRSAFDLYVKSVGGDGLLQLTDSPDDDLEPAWSPDGRWIAFVENVGAEQRIKLVPPLGGEVQTLAQATGADEPTNAAISWLPDSSAVLFTQKADDQPARVWSVRLADGAVTPISSLDPTAVTDRFPEASGAAGRIAFIRQTDAYGHAVRTANLDGSDEREVYSGPTGIYGIAWSPDGRELLLALPLRLRQFPLMFRMPAEGGTPRLVDGVGAGAEPSTNSRRSRMAYERKLVEVSIRRFAVGAEDALGASEVLAPSSASEWGARWSPDGTRLAFVSGRDGSDQIWLAEADGSAPVRLTTMKGVAGAPEWSPDGKRIVFAGVEHGSQFQIFIVDTETGELSEFAPSESYMSRPTWSPDGRSLYFNSDQTGRQEIWRKPVDGGPAEQVTSEGGRCPRFSRDGAWLYYAPDRSKPGVRRLSLSTGETTEVAPDVQEPGLGRWVVRGESIYYLDRASRDGAEATWAVCRRSLTDGTKSVVAPLPGWAPESIKGLDVSADETQILISGIDRDESDLMYVEEFR